MKELFRVAAALSAVAAFALVAGTAPAGARTAGNSVTYQDSTGEDPASFDISQIVVSNDDTGLLTFAITLKNGPAALSGRNDVSIYFDTDNNMTDSSGPSYDGAELTIEVADGSVNAYKWDGNNFTWSGAQPSSLVYSYGGGVLTIRVNANDLSLGSFGFWVLADTDYGDPNSHVDEAPDPGHGNFDYQVKISPPAPPATTQKHVKPVPKCKKKQKSTKAHPCHK